MSYKHKSHRITEILTEKKCLPEADTVELKNMGKTGKGRRFETRPELVDGPFVDMRYLGKAPLLDDPASYDASFLIDNQRVRGIGYNETGRNNFRLKERIPKGWHMNICDPNLNTTDHNQNIHQHLPEFSTTDFRDFINQTASIWKIDLGWQWESETLL